MRRRMDMVLRNDAVPMPKEKITFKKASNGTEYVYYTLRAYRNKNGKPTSDEAAIGKKDPGTGMLIPNRRYYEIFHATDPSEIDKAAASAPQRVRSCGNVVALTEISKQTGLAEILRHCFPVNWDRILACAFYMVCEGNVMMYIEDWFEETRVGLTDWMDDIDCSRLFASITEEERLGFFKRWVKYRGEQEYIVYDVSSISTYSKNISIAEWGYNRDNDNLPQMNLGMYYGATSQMPVYYDLYSGSIPDKTYLEYMMATSKDLGILNVCFVMDRGFVMDENLTCIEGNGYSFITAMPGNMLEARRLIDENKSLVRKSANRIKDFDVYCIQRPFEMYGLNLQAHIYFSSEKQAFDEKELYARIEKLHDELEKISKSKRVTKRYRDYFTIDEKAQEALTFDLDTEKVDERLERAGFFVLISSDSKLTSGEVIRIYRDRDSIEKNFDEFKNRLDFKRMRTHWNKTTEGKMFVGFLALILRSQIRRLMKASPQTKHLTFEKVLIELRKIKSVTLADQREALVPLTKLQKTILAALAVPAELIGY